MNSKNSLLRIVLFATCIAPAAVLASKEAAVAGAVKTAPASSAAAAAAGGAVAAEGVNPMTGRPLSEEGLMRALSRARLQTQLEQESLKLTQTKGEIALSAVRLDVERKKLTGGGGSFNAGPIPVGPSPAQGRPSTPAIPPLVSGMPQGAGMGAPALATSMPALVQPQPQAYSAGPASGGLEFGGVRIAAVSNLPSAASRVEYVDVHATGAPAKGGGASRPQIVGNVMPAAPVSR